MSKMLGSADDVVVDVLLLTEDVEVLHVDAVKWMLDNAEIDGCN